MKLLFKLVGEPTKPTLGDTNFRNHYPDINVNTGWQSVRHAVKQATRAYVIPYITEKLYKGIAEKYDTSAEMNADEKELLEMLQDCIAEYTIWHLSPRLNITISDFGIRQDNGSNGTSNPAQMWAYKHAMWKVMESADRQLDSILRFLEAKTFADYEDARAELTPDDLLVSHTNDFQKWVDISKSRRTFVKLLPSIRKAQDSHIKTLLGVEQYAELLEKRKDNSLNGTERNLLEIVQKCLVYESFVQGLPFLRCKIDGGAVFSLTDIDGMNTKQTGHYELVEQLKQQAIKDSYEAECELKNYLYENVEELPTWGESEAKKSQDSSTGMPFTFGAGGVFLD